MSQPQSAENDAADYGYADLPSKGGMKIIPNIPPEMTTCRTCGRVATEHTAGRFSIYGTCPIPPEVTQP